MNKYQKSYFQVPLYNTTISAAITTKTYPKGILSSAFPRAWDSGYTGKNIVVAVIDTGIDANHPDLQGSVVQTINLTNSNLSISHGTHVAGTIAAHGQIVGGAYDCKLIDIMVLGEDGSSIDNVMRGITLAADNGADIINLSAGGTNLSLFDIGRLNSVVQYAWNMGAICISAAGNDGTSIMTPDIYSYPASADQVESVASCDVGINLDTIELNAFSNENSTVDMTACGYNVLSCTIGGYGIYSGTSMATPHVSALAAVLAEPLKRSGVVGSQFSEQLVNILYDNILPIDRGLIHSSNYSYGRGFIRYQPRNGPYMPNTQIQYVNGIFVGYAQ